ncbi:MAG: nickel pincer cofactor biosynthesis protein LarC [Oscillospiraceae bacterium]|nr:nickel pincer cofactor biosynthesis protein LarC [Oscillospiraceae bacterium]
MRTLYIDCGMGAAGDMLTGALLDLLDEAEQAAFLREMNAALAGKALVTAERDTKCGVKGLHVRVTVNGEEEGRHHHHHDGEHHHHHHEGEHHHHYDDGEHHHHHNGIREIRALIDAMPLSDNVRFHAREVFDSIARAECEVHGEELEHIHFHEVGTLDAVADVVGVCLLMEKLRPEQVLCSPINVGGGTVKCAHGILPVPAPATEILLRGKPWYEGEIKTELCTPTGAALAGHFANRFERAPVLRVEKCGYGMGTKNFERLNAVRVLLGEAAGEPDTLLELRCNLDDMTGEELGFAMERLFDAGALDVWTTAIGMKKNRPGVLLSVLCRREQHDALLGCLFKHTTTLGVRELLCPRYPLERSFRRAETPWGEVTVKGAEGWGVSREKPEYEDLARIAKENDLSLRDVKAEIK